MTDTFQEISARIIELWDADCDIDKEVNQLRELLIQPQPEQAGEVSDDELHALWDTGFEGDFQDCRRFFREAVEHFALDRTRRAQPVAIEPRGCPTPGACSCVEPAPPTEGEVAELVRRLRYAKQNGNWIPSSIHWGLDDGTEHQGSICVGSNHAADCSRAAELLERQQPLPVAVSERLPGDALCWWFTPESGEEYGWWVLETHGMEREPQPTHWLPIEALPQPSQSEAGS